MRVERLALGSKMLSIARVNSSGHEIKLTERENFTIILPTSGRLSATDGDKEYRADAGAALLFNPNTRLTRVEADKGREYSALVLMVPQAVFRSLVMDAETPGRSKPVPEGLSLGGHVAGLSSLREFLAFLIRDFSSRSPALAGERAREAAETLAIEQLRHCFAAGSGYESQIHGKGPTRTVRLAVTYMHEHYFEPLSMSRIAAAAGVSVRSLHAAFQAVQGASPWNCLTSIRMEKARAALSRSDDRRTVTHVALDCGFTHSGRFSQLYKLRFGETPSETLRRSA